MQREVSGHAHMLVVIEIDFFIDLVENASLSRAIWKSLEEALLFLIEGECVRVRKQS